MHQREKSAFGRLAGAELGLAVNESGFSRNSEGSLVLGKLTRRCSVLAAVGSSAPSGRGGRERWKLALFKGDREGGLLPFARL